MPLRVFLRERDAGATEILVGNEHGTAPGRVTPRAFRDEGRTLDRWLNRWIVDTGRSVLEPGLYEHVVGKVGTPNG